MPPMNAARTTKIGSVASSVAERPAAVDRSRSATFTGVNADGLMPLSTSLVSAIRRPYSDSKALARAACRFDSAQEAS